MILFMNSMIWKVSRMSYNLDRWLMKRLYNYDYWKHILQESRNVVDIWGYVNSKTLSRTWDSLWFQ